MSGLFITGAGTDVGKTFVTCALIHQLRRERRKLRALKPVISGYDAAKPGASDSGRILAALGELASDAEITRISPWRYLMPVAPNMAAKREGRPVRFAELITFCHKALQQAETITLIEGVGGVMSPITDDMTNLDWMAALACPAVLVTGSYLGSISHALTAAVAMETRGIALAGVVVSESTINPVPLRETTESIARLLPDHRVIALPRLASFIEAPDLTALLGVQEESA
jgi:dethiobiotin synthetase